MYSIYNFGDLLYHALAFIGCLASVINLYINITKGNKNGKYK